MQLLRLLKMLILQEYGRQVIFIEGCSNSMGLMHWFETDTFSFDFSLITKSERMVKGTFAGNNWDQLNMSLI